jgi:hypothetical protein
MNRSLLALTSLAILASASMPLAVQAQSESRGVAGIKGGAAFGMLSNDEDLPNDLDDRTGFAAGIYGGVRLGVILIGIEALYAQRGLTSDLATNALPTRLDYIDIPIYAEFILPIPAVQPYIYIGPQVSFEISCETASGGSCPEPSARSKTDFLGVGGLGVRLGSVSGFGVGIEGRYLFGFQDLDLDGVAGTTDNKNRGFMFLVSLGR